jgi:hypothetical protein
MAWYDTVVPSDSKWYRRMLDPADVFGTAPPPPAEDRTMQIDNIKQLQAQAAGTAGPSQTELMLQHQSQQNVSAQYALAQTLRARTAAGASQNAVAGAATTNAALSEAAALTRAREQAEYRRQLTDAITQVRNNDLGVTAAVNQEKAAQRNMFGGFLGGITSALVAKQKRPAAEDTGYGADGTGSNLYPAVGD